ncbi:hypothetical protein GALMADRAFT_810684 [Galerina marginata CBS 339.88]|uniref:Uncharacterized protein n=1 Tax=Galerina marginata (strain CBS 339.88) TaxID=685588 RepID=A0A067ST20_GALM3|nr:hypothetical protein GALMADRAFT_810684 [Galerina marginata CBS 339.88]
MRIIKEAHGSLLFGAFYRMEYPDRHTSQHWKGWVFQEKYIRYPSFTAHLSRAEIVLDAAHKIAAKRSGQRGRTARRTLLIAERDLATLRPQTSVTTKIVHDITMEVFVAYETLNVEANQARAKTILRGLGFSDEDLAKEGKELAD